MSLLGTLTSSQSAFPVLDKDDFAEGNEDAVVPSLKQVTKKKTLIDNEDSRALPSALTAIDGKDQLSAKPLNIEDAEAMSAAPNKLDLEVNADMQPAHHAKALDILASIELKFALLQEHVYVEKTKGIA